MEKHRLDVSGAAKHARNTPRRLSPCPTFFSLFSAVRLACSNNNNNQPGALESHPTASLCTYSGPHTDREAIATQHPG